MRKLTKAEFLRLEFVTKSKHPCSQELMDKVSTLKKNEALLVLKEDWKMKTPPASYAYKTAKEKGRSFITKRLKNESGWAVYRSK